MKNYLLVLLAICSSFIQAQEWSPTGATTTTNIFRTGNVGIGTSSPTSKLHLGLGDFKLDNGNIYHNIDPLSIPSWVTSSSLYNSYSNKGFYIRYVGLDYGPTFSMEWKPDLNTAGSGFQAGLSHCNGCFNSEAVAGDVVVRGSSRGSFIISNDLSGDIKFSTRKSGTNISYSRMIINDEGNVAIGTNQFDDGADTFKLSVNGFLRANRVKVYTSWADYVFLADYKLPTLEEVEDYINKNGHLQDIPSAETVEENGIELGEMNKLLLQKIEELTLYVIELNKEVQNLKGIQNEK